MSRHYFDATIDDKPVFVIAGWEPSPQNYFFLDIQKADEEEEVFVYSNFYDEKHCQPTTFDPFVAILSAYGITLPQPMIIDIMDDANHNVGYKIRRWVVETCE